MSADGGHVGVAQYLAPMMGGHVFDLTNAKDTALHRAAKNGHLPMVEHLVKVTGFDVKDKNKVCSIWRLSWVHFQMYAMTYSTIYHSSLLYLMTIYIIISLCSPAYCKCIQMYYAVYVLGY